MAAQTMCLNGAVRGSIYVLRYTSDLIYHCIAQVFMVGATVAASSLGDLEMIAHKRKLESMHVTSDT